MPKLVRHRRMWLCEQVYQQRVCLLDLCLRLFRCSSWLIFHVCCYQYQRLLFVKTIDSKRFCQDICPSRVSLCLCFDSLHVYFRQQAVERFIFAQFDVDVFHRHFAALLFVRTNLLLSLHFTIRQFVLQSDARRNLPLQQCDLAFETLDVPFLREVLEVLVQ